MCVLKVQINEYSYAEFSANQGALYDDITSSKVGCRNTVSTN